MGSKMTAQSLASMAFIGLVGGAVFTVVVVFIALKLNLKGVGTVYRDVPQNGRFYRAWAILGGALGASFLTAMPILDASGIKDPWYGLILIAIALVLFLPMIRFLKRHRDGGRITDASERGSQRGDEI